MYRSITLFLGIFLLLFTQLAAAHQTPSLMALAITGPPHAPFLEPAAVKLTQGEEYLFVIHNETLFPLTFYFDKLGQSVLTHYRQGTPSVSQDRMELPAQSKVLWHFVALNPGEFSCLLSNTMANQSGPNTTIAIISNKPPENTPPNSEEPKTTVPKKRLPSIIHRK